MLRVVEPKGLGGPTQVLRSDRKLQPRELPKGPEQRFGGGPLGRQQRQRFGDRQPAALLRGLSEGLSQRCKILRAEVGGLRPGITKGGHPAGMVVGEQPQPRQLLAGP